MDGQTDADQVQIISMENGPNRISGPVKLLGADSREIEHPDVFALCRCGRSASKPFCDGTHRSIGFQAPGAQITKQG